MARAGTRRGEDSGGAALSEREPPEAIEPETQEGSSPAPVWFRRLAFYSVTGGLCALMPIPFLDERLLRLTRRRMVREMAGQRQLRLSDAEVAHLSGTEPSSLFGCFLGVVLGIVLKGIYLIVRRVFRSILFFLALKDAVDEASHTFHEGYLIHQSLPDLQGQLDNDARPEDAVRPPVRSLRSAIVETCQTIDPRPIEKTIKGVFRGSYRLLRRAARLFARDARKQHLDEEGPLPRGGTGAAYAPEIAERLGERLAEQTGYLTGLETRLHALWPEVSEEL